ncbi:hypothetical protein [Winogradskyella pulchriflava]|uniref:Uncharacterized protein n=1 Tax=Winogradskyella pulchriflava TaxID=1110688 RepID=A0ABV6Q9Q6_9FLAO
MKTFLVLVLFACSCTFAQNTINQDIINTETFTQLTLDYLNN